MQTHDSPPLLCARGGATTAARCLLLGFVICLALAGAPRAHAQADFVYFSTDLGTLPYDQALMVLALEGTVNRDAARLYVNTRTLSPWSWGNPRGFRNEWDETWLEIYGARGLTIEAVTDVRVLLGHLQLRPLVSGLVIYDPTELEATTWIAMTIAGVEDRLPVTPAILSALPELSAWWPDALDLRGRWDSRTAAYQWTVDSYLVQTSDAVAYVIGHDFPGGDPGDIIALDYAVAKAAFIFDLSLDQGNHPEEAALADTIVRHLSAPAALMGWYEELTFCDFASQRGNYALNGVCASNLSFHRHMPPISPEPLQQTTRYTPDELYLDPNTYYLAVVYSDGDIPQRLTRFFSGDWFSAARGQVPMNWGIDPALVDEFPALFEYFYSNATPNDYFVAGPSSAGYTHPSLMPNRDDYAAFVAACDAACDINIAVVWDYDLSPTIWDPFLAASGLQAVIHDKLEIRDLFFRGDHVPFFPSTFFWCWFFTPDPTVTNLANDILSVMSEIPPPAFAIIYDDFAQRPDVAKQVMDLLSPQGFVFLRMDEMNALARQIDHFYDVGTKYWAHDEVEACFGVGIVGGYSETHYCPTRPVSRDQMAVFISRSICSPTGEAGMADYVPPDTPSFSDVPTDFWCYKYIEYAAANSIVGGYEDGTYHPEYNLDRGQMAVFIARAIAGDDQSVPDPVGDPSFPDVPSDFWAYKYIEYIAAEEVAGGYFDGNYYPENPVTRDQMAVFICRAFDLP